MPIDVSRALSAKLPPVTSHWGVDDVILFHLGIGAGFTRTPEEDLQYLYERDLKVVPTFSVLVGGNALPDMSVNAVPGIDIDMTALLHGSQETIIRRPLPPTGDITTTCSVAEVWDKGSAGVIVLENTSTDESGEVLFIDRSSMFVRGEGGFGGEKGPSSSNKVPERGPDAVIASPTMGHQAYLYRLSGDKNPLHADPQLAKAAGFEKPILHGVCTYGMVCKAVIDELLDGDVTKVRGFSARFAGVVFPGETIVTSAWREDDRIIVSAETKQRQTPVLTNSAVLL